MGLLDFDDPDNAGMTGIAQGLLAASGPSRMPISFGQALAGALHQGQESYGNATQLQMMKTRDAMQKMQLAMMQKQIATKEALGRALAGQSAAQPIPESQPAYVNQFGGGMSIDPQYAPQRQPQAAPVKPMSNAERLANAAIQAGDYDAYQQAQHLLLEEKKLNPKFATDVRVVRINGKPTPVQMADDGTWRPMGEGVDIAEKLHFGDIGGKLGAFDQYTGQMVNQTDKTVSPDSLLSANVTMRGQNMTDSREKLLQSPQYQANVTMSKKLAEGQANAIETLPNVISTADTAIRNIEGLVGKRDAKGNLIEGSKPHPGFSSSVGAKIPGLKYIPGSEAADFNARLDQVLGGAFMQAYQSLKGGGQITEIEGKKATDAITRMSTAQSEKEFVDAAQEFKGVIQSGVARAKLQAGINQKTIVATGTYGGRKVVKYSDGSTGYAD